MKEEDVDKLYRCESKTPNIEIGQFKTYNYYDDPRRFSFDSSRYKFCSKMLSDKDRVMEIGCNDAMWSPIVAQTVKHLIAIDNQPFIIEDDKKRLNGFKNIEFRCEDITKGINIKVDAIYSLDVLEHIDSKYDDTIIKNICKCLNEDGICIIGTPNKTAEVFASEISKLKHINLKTFNELKILMQMYFKNVFMFGMNDEIVHTGFPPMCNYLLAIGVSPK